MEFRGARFNVFGTIDLEINDPIHGWLPFTASPDDPEEFGRSVFAAVSKGDVAAYVPPPPEPEPVPDRVTARQFKLQLLADDILDQVEAWVASQGRAIQLAYDNSSEFVRDEPMMQAGFRALGFPSEQITAFFSAASKR